MPILVGKKSLFSKFSAGLAYLTTLVPIRVWHTVDRYIKHRTLSDKYNAHACYKFAAQFWWGITKRVTWIDQFLNSKMHGLRCLVVDVYVAK